MVTLEQVKAGLAKYIDKEMLPHLNGFAKIGLGAYSALAMSNLGAVLMKYKDAPAVSILGVIDEEGNVDIDKLYDAVIPVVANEKLSFDIPVIGRYTINRMDIEKIYGYIKES